MSGTCKGSAVQDVIATEDRARRSTRRGGRASIVAVVDSRACCGCGACVAACPVDCIEMQYGRRFNWPRIDESRCTKCGLCIQVCPSAFLLDGTAPDFDEDLRRVNYPCHLVHSPDDAVRLDAASGGGITGLILHLMETGQAEGAVVARCTGANPLAAEAFLATDRTGLLEARGSKYTPVSSCTVLREVLDRPGRYVFVGTPCMVEGLTRLEGLRPVLADRITLKISMVCSGMSSRESTRKYIADAGVDPRAARRISYRGDGWPGRFRVYGDDDRLLLDRPYLEDAVVHIVSRDHYLRCWNCVDHWGRLADVVACDPWTRDMVERERKGWSALMSRTERGHEAVTSAIEHGALVARPITVEDMLGYNRPLVLGPDHPRHAWMAAYQLIFRRRWKYLGSVLGRLLRRRQVGFVTTLRARFQRHYYDREPNEGVRARGPQ